MGPRYWLLTDESHHSGSRSVFTTSRTYKNCRVIATFSSSVHAHNPLCIHTCTNYARRRHRIELSLSPWCGKTSHPPRRPPCRSKYSEQARRHGGIRCAIPDGRPPRATPRKARPASHASKHELQGSSLAVIHLPRRTARKSSIFFPPAGRSRTCRTEYRNIAVARHRRIPCRQRLLHGDDRPDVLRGRARGRAPAALEVHRNPSCMAR